MRLFIAIRFSPEIREVLLDAIDTLRVQADANFTRPENLHLTLAFIGESRDVMTIRRCMDALTPGAFPLTVGGCGRFGDLWWAGVAPNERLAALAGELTDRLRAAGFDMEKRAFKPHITLARRVRPLQGPVRLAVPERMMTADRISLMRSDRINGRLTYTEVYARPL